MKQAYILRGSLKAGTESSFREYEPEIDPVVIARLAGDKLSEEEIAQLPEYPTLTLPHPFRCDCVPEVFGYLRGSKFFTPKMRNYLEHLEPGVHRYFPIRLRSEVPIGGKTEHGEHFLLIKPPLLDCLVIEETKFNKGFGMAGWKQGGGYLSNAPGSICTLKKSVVEGHHLWRTKISDGEDEYTCSDEFWEGVKNEFQIWEPHTQCVLK